MIGIDTTFIIDFLRGDTAAISKAAEIKAQNLVTTQINVYEVLVGLYLSGASGKSFTQFWGLMDKLERLDMGSEATAMSARLFGECMRKGSRVEQNDCMIAGILKSQGCSKIVTRNASDFKKLGLDVILY